MGALAALQAAHDSSAADQSAATGDASASESSTDTGSTTNSTTTASASEGSVGYSSQAVKGNSALSAAGYTVTESGVTSADGKTMSASDFSSSGSMSAAGIDSKTIQEAQKILAGVSSDLSKAKVSSVDVSDGAGGGTYTREKDSTTDLTFVNPFALSAARKRQIVAGKTKNLNGEPIGVKGQNLFDMVHAVYVRKTEARQFLETNEAQTK